MRNAAVLRIGIPETRPSQDTAERTRRQWIVASGDCRASLLQVAETAIVFTLGIDEARPSDLEVHLAAVVEKLTTRKRRGIHDGADGDNGLSDLQ